MVKILKWTSNEAVHSLPPKDRRSISPATCALIPCFTQTIQLGRSAPVLPLSLDLILLFASLNDELEQFNFVIIVEMSVIYDRIIYNHYNDII